MSNKRKSPRLFVFASGALAAGALLIGLPARAEPTQPATTEEARTMANDSMVRAEQYRDLGGVGYKNGLVQREEADAARYAALADQLAAPPVLMVESPEAEHYATLAAHYRFVGGAAYKTGFVQWAEAQERRYEPVPLSTLLEPAPATNAICTADKPSVELLCSSL